MSSLPTGPVFYVDSSALVKRYVEIDPPLVDLAVKLTRRQKLRGYDALQLAAALTLNQVVTQAQFPPLTFVAADNDLLQAAQNEGLAIDSPNLYP